MAAGEVAKRLLLAGLLINVRKIRVEPDNKRLARCTNTALTQSRKIKINEYIE
jgi:hypothetical protein